MARPLSAKARERILSSSRELLLDSGLAAFTVDEIAARSGVAKSTIYRHFDSANELLIATLEQLVIPFPVPDTGDLRSDLLALAATAVPIFADLNLRRLLLGVITMAAGDDELDRIHRAMMHERKGPLRAVIEAARSRGELPSALTFDVAFDFLEGPFTTRWLHDPQAVGQIDIETTVDRAIAAMTTQPRLRARD